LRLREIEKDRERERERGGGGQNFKENCKMSSFMTYSLYQTLFGLSNYGAWKGLSRYMYEGSAKLTRSLVREREGKCQLGNLSLDINTVEKYLKK
jgi:hypothetical protein